MLNIKRRGKKTHNFNEQIIETVYQVGANVRLNGANVFSVAKKTDSSRPIMTLENLNLRWIDKRTVV